MHWQTLPIAGPNCAGNQAGEHGVRFLLISGAPIEVPVAWHVPIAMNPQEELQTAIRNLRNGTFI